MYMYLYIAIYRCMQTYMQTYVSMCIYMYSPIIWFFGGRGFLVVSLLYTQNLENCLAHNRWSINIDSILNGRMRANGFENRSKSLTMTSFFPQGKILNYEHVFLVVE